MAVEVAGGVTYCYKCGRAFSKKKGYFYVNHSQLYRGLGYLSICKECVDSIYEGYLVRSNGDQKSSLRKLCRKLDLYWNESLYESSVSRSTSRTLVSQYIQKLGTVQQYINKCYDDTILEEAKNSKKAREEARPVENAESVNIEHVVERIEISDDVKDFWGPGYTPEMYMQLEQRRQYWMSRLSNAEGIDIGTEALIRQICSLEIDINRDRTAGKSIDKSVNALNTLIKTANLNPTQPKEDIDASANNTPLGVWIYKFENERPLPEIDEDMKDVNKVKKYIFTWMGHICKMVGLKNYYSKLYDEEIERLRVERPEYEDEDDEDLIVDVFSGGGDSG